MVHRQAHAHFCELTQQLAVEATQDKLERLQTLLYAALDCAYSAGDENSRLLERVTELEQIIAWQRVSIDELTHDRQLLVTVIEAAACMPPLFTYARRAASASR
jgi:hypothetical protein